MSPNAYELNNMLSIIHNVWHNFCGAFSANNKLSSLTWDRFFFLHSWSKYITYCFEKCYHTNQLSNVSLQRGVFSFLSFLNAFNKRKNETNSCKKNLINRKAKLYDKKNVITDEKLCICVWWTCMSVYDRIENKVIMIVENEKSWKRAKAWEWIVFHEVLQFRIHIVGRTIDERVCVCIPVYRARQRNVESRHFRLKIFQAFLGIQPNLLYLSMCVCLWLCVCVWVFVMYVVGMIGKRICKTKNQTFYTHRKKGRNTYTHTYTCNAYSSPHTHSRYTVCRLDEKWKKCS